MCSDRRSSSTNQSCGFALICDCHERIAFAANKGELNPAAHFQIRYSHVDGQMKRTFNIGNAVGHDHSIWSSA
jgi:hypothetical protein